MSAARETDGDYILGADRAELERLRFQHKAWLEAAYALWTRAGLKTGDTVLDLGCGPGYTSLELAHVVGSTGRVIARDQSEHFLAHLRSECHRLGFAHVEASLGPVEVLAFEAGELDAAYARWLLCWLEEPAPVLARVAHGLRPGGVVALQEYLDWGAMRLVPGCDSFERAVEACMQSWREGGGTIDIARHAPDLARSAGLELEHLSPIARTGRIGSLEWRWLGAFHHAYLPKLVERGLLDPDELAAFRADWREREEGGTSWIYTPVMADVVLRKR